MNEKHYYHAVARAAHGEYHAVKRLRGNAPSWQEAYEALVYAGTPVPDPASGEEELWRLDIQLILASEDGFPKPLRHIAQPPFGLYVRGNAAALRRSVIVDVNAHKNEVANGSGPGMIAIVGTRRASAEGKRTARDFARELAHADFAIASGLAFGIDAAAHEGALDADGATVAVLAGGLDGIYPHTHEALARRLIAQGGALLSEYPPGEEAFGYRFIERNRIVSGLARGTIIVEAPMRSGALATARYAMEQNRDLFVVPGGIRDDRFAGSLPLIRQGAFIAITPDDILAAYEVAVRPSAERSAESASPEETLVLTALKAIGAGADVDKISEVSKLEPRIVNRALGFLLIRGIVKETDIGYTI